MKATIKNVAHEAGVSLSTVSRVASGHSSVREETYRKVKKVIDDMGYTPDFIAKSLVSKTTSSIGVLLPKQEENISSNTISLMEMVRGMTARANLSGFEVFISTGSNEKEEIEIVSRLLKGRRVDGIIVCSSRKDDAVIDFLKLQEYPFVLIGRSDKYNGILSVDTDNLKAAYDATNHLIAMGHNRIGFAHGPSNLIVSSDRLKGYRRALLDNGLEVHSEWIVDGESLQNKDYQDISSLMKLRERPTAILAVDDITAFSVISDLNKLKYKVPNDMAVVSFNNTMLTELSIPPISSIDIGIYQLGYTASKVLIESIRRPRNETPSSKRYIIEHRLIVRESSIPTRDQLKIQLCTKS